MILNHPNCYQKEVIVLKRKRFAVLSAAVMCLLPGTAGGYTAAAEEVVYPSSYEEYTALLESCPEFYRIDSDSIYFINQDIQTTEMSLIVSSNQEVAVTKNTYGYIFKPEENGRYVVTVEEFSEEIVSAGSGHFHYFYPVLVNYVVTVEEDTITIEQKGSRSWYSEEQIAQEIELASQSELMACYDVMADGADDTEALLGSCSYFSFVNGQIFNMLDGYITTVYGAYTTESYFCVNLDYVENDTDLPRVIVSDESIGVLLPELSTSSWCDGNLMEKTCDIMIFYRVKALQDGSITITTDGLNSYELTVENGIFYRGAPNSSMPLLPGDVSNDGVFSVVDVVMLQKWLLCAGDMTCWQNADFNADNRIDVVDLALMKRAMLEHNTQSEMLLTSSCTSMGTNSYPYITFTLDASQYSLPTPMDALPYAALYNADTDELIALMYDDGEAEHGDAAACDNIWSCIAEINNATAGTLCFYATVNGKDGCQGETVKSNIISIEIYEIAPPGQ